MNVKLVCAYGGNRLTICNFYGFPRIKRLPPYVFNVVGDLKLTARRAGEDIIDFGMGNPDGPTPPHIVAKLVEAAQKPPNHRYSVSRGIYKLRVAICDWYRRRYGVELDPDTRGRSSRSARRRASRTWRSAMLGPGDVVLCPSPTYPIHQYSVIIAGGDLRSIPLMPGGDFFEHLLEAVRTDAGRSRSCSSSTSRTTRPPRSSTCAFFERIVDFAREHECLVVHDLAYADLVLRRLRGAVASCRCRARRTSASSSSRSRRATTCRAGGSASRSATAR